MNALANAAPDLAAVAAQALDALRAVGFDQAQVAATASAMTELNANDNEPSLLRSTDTRKLALTGIVDGRVASTELGDFDAAAIRERARALFTDAQSAPQDAANAVSAGQHARITQGPAEPDHDALVAAVAGVLAHRARTAPGMMLRDTIARHYRQRTHMLTSGGSDLAADVGWYELMALGTAREGQRSSSMNYAYGNTHALDTTAPQTQFGLDRMLRETPEQIDTRPFDGKFEGDVVLTPGAVASLIGWLLGQVGDQQLIARSSLYIGSVGERIASPLLTLRSRPEAPGVAPLSADAFVAPSVTLLEGGVLRTLLPTFYGSRKTGLTHRPVADGWELAPGNTPLADVVGGVQRGALVGRLSMGNPAANGNFSSVIKNSFAIARGERSHALAETMISGNMAQMLRNVVAVSAETEEVGSWRLPWVRVGGLHFS